MVPQLEPIVAFLQFDDFTVGRIERAVGQAIFVGQKSFLFRRVKTLVSLLVELSCFMEFRKNRLDEFLVARLGGADKIIVGQFQFSRKRLPIRGELIAISLGRFAFGNGGLLDFLAVLIMPVRKKISWPRLRRDRAMTSATIFS